MKRNGKKLAGMFLAFCFIFSIHICSFAQGWENIGAKGEDATWIYRNEDGSLVKNDWRQSGYHWFLLGPDGYMVETENQLVQVNGATYYLGKYGVRAEFAWYGSEPGDKMFFGKDGKQAVNRWSGTSYLGADGRMLVNTWTPDGHFVDEQGNWVSSREDQGSILAGWKEDEKGRWYQYPDGSYPVSQGVWIDDNSDGIAEHYFFDRDGYLITSDYIETPNSGIVAVDDKGRLLDTRLSMKNSGTSATVLCKNVTPGTVNEQLFDEHSFLSSLSLPWLEMNLEDSVLEQKAELELRKQQQEYLKKFFQQML